jgi:hypothetical protein
MGKNGFGQLFSVFNEWTKRRDSVIESGGEYYTKEKRFALIACLFVKIERGLNTFWPLYASNIIVPSSVFFRWLARTLTVTRIGICTFASLPIIVITILRHVQIFSVSCFSNCESLSSISFETGHELTRIESNSFSFCSSLKSITVPQNA